MTTINLMDIISRNPKSDWVNAIPSDMDLVVLKLNASSSSIPIRVDYSELRGGDKKVLNNVELDLNFKGSEDSVRNLLYTGHVKIVSFASGSNLPGDAFGLFADCEADLVDFSDLRIAPDTRVISDMFSGFVGNIKDFEKLDLSSVDSAEGLFYQARVGKFIWNNSLNLRAFGDQPFNSAFCNATFEMLNLAQLEVYSEEDEKLLKEIFENTKAEGLIYPVQARAWDIINECLSECRIICDYPETVDIFTSGIKDNISHGELLDNIALALENGVPETVILQKLKGNNQAIYKSVAVMLEKNENSKVAKKVMDRTIMVSLAKVLAMNNGSSAITIGEAKRELIKQYPTSLVNAAITDFVRGLYIVKE